MSQATAVLYHNDADGFGAAYAHWCNVSGEGPTTYLPVQYGQPVPEIPKGVTRMYIVDFSYDRKTCEELAYKYDLTIIDHHKTAELELERLPYAHFDMNKSGAVLAWEYFTGGDPAPSLLQYVQDRDLWQWELPNSEEINLGIAAMPFEFEDWYKAEMDDLLMAGKAIKSFQDGQIKSSMKSIRIMTLGCEVGDFEVPVCNATANISELGNEMCKAYPKAPFSISYCDRADIRTWSLRSIGEFDVSAVAKTFGGGGHKNAAGFTTAVNWPECASIEFLTAFEEAINEKTSS